MTWLKVLGVVLLLGGAYYFGYDTAQTKANLEFTEYQLEAKREYNKLLQEKVLWEKETKAKISEVEKIRLDELEGIKAKYEKIISDMRKSFKPNGVHKCNSAQSGERPADNPSELVCYSRADLYGRIAQTVAIGAKADKLATDYNTILKIIEAYNHE